MSQNSIEKNMSYRLLIVCLLIAGLSAIPVAAEESFGDEYLYGFVNNISAMQTIQNPIVVAGDGVNITIRFTTPNEALTGAIQVNATPAGWGISPVWITGNADPDYDDNPAMGRYHLNRTGTIPNQVVSLPGTWSQATQAIAWTSTTSKTRVYSLNYFVTVPVGTALGNYSVKAFANSYSPAGTQTAVVPGDTIITVVGNNPPFGRDCMRLLLPNTTVTRNVFTLLPVQVANMTRGTGLSFNLTYDPAIIYVNNITLNQSYASAGCSLSVNSTPGLLRVALTSTELINIGSPEKILFLNLTGIGAGGSSTALLAQDAMWSNDSFFIQLSDVCNGAVRIGDSGKQIRVSSLSGIPLNATGLVNVSIIAPQAADAFTLNFTYDPGVMKITNRLNDVPGWSVFATPGQGSYVISGFANSPAYSLSADTRLFDFRCEALRNDGKPTFINTTITSLEENTVEMRNEYSTVNGTFTPATGTPAPIAGFIANQTNGTVPFAVQFTDTSTNSPTSWAWYFGDETYTAPWTQVNASAGWAARAGQSSVVLPDGSIVLMGGAPSIGGFKNDVWRSMDNGATWTQQTASAGWAARSAHSSVVLPDGSIVLMGGDTQNGGVYTNDVWRSIDKGATWTRMTANAEWVARGGHMSVALSDGSIVLMGGNAGSWYSGIYKNDVWRSTDKGATWTQVTASAGWAARSESRSVLMPDGSIVLMGGAPSIGGYKNDVWRSTDSGATWTQQTASAGWAARSGHSSVAMPDNSIILSGGYTGVQKNDVWRSTDSGATWTQVTANAEWSARSSHSSVVVPDGSIILMGSGSSGFGNDVWRFQPTGSSLQHPMHTYTSAGSYTVSLQVFNTGGFNSTRKTGYITVTQQPVPTLNMLNGTIYYSGNENAPIYVYLFNQTPAPGVIPFKTKNLTYYGTPIKYGFTAGNGTFWVMSYMDINGNLTPDANEPWGFAINRTSQQGPDPIQVTGNVTGLDVTLIEPQLYISLMLTKGYNVNTTNNAILAGTQDSRLGYQMVLYPTTPSESSYVLGNLSFVFAAQNISNVDHKQFAVWNSSTAVWTFPPEFTLKTNNGLTVTADTSIHADKPLNMSLSRKVNQTVFAENGTQLLTVNITFTSTDSLASGCIIDVPYTTRVHSRFIPGSVSTNAPTKWIDVYDQWVMFDFNQTAIRAGVPYTLSIISQVAPNGTPVEFIPRVSVSQTFYHNSTMGTLAPVGVIPTALLPKEVTMASAAVNVSGIWDFTIQHNIGATLDCVALPVSSAPFANFSATPTSGNVPLTVWFTDTSANTPTAWIWNFGDNSSVNATVQHPVHTYAAAGTYTISLNATNAGGSNMTTRTGYITVNAIRPTLWNMSMNVTSGTYNQNVVMGSAISATRGYDAGLDIPVPPDPPGAKKIVYFSIEDAIFDHLSTDYKPPVNATNTVEFWTLYIKSNETVKVYWDTSLTGNPNLTFLWNDGTTTVNMRTVTNATLPAGEYYVNLSVSTTARTDMSLKYGWNLVSVPFTSAQYVVPANAISTIYSYNPVTRGYEGPVQISSLEPGKAYWVAATRDCIVNVTGQPAQPIVKGLKTGWNLIGGTDSSVPFSSITIDPSGSWSLSFVYGYNVQTRMYDQVTSLQSGKGYWGAVNRDCTITIP